MRRGAAELQMLVPGGLKVLGAYGAVAPGGGASQLRDAAQALLSSVPSQLVLLHVTPPIHSGQYPRHWEHMKVTSSASFERPLMLCPSVLMTVSQTVACS